ncbi:ComEA family DNA-binding protein [Echinimonas agarilytica]|uniref:ComEA family DNA-binding protein n=1 Tax=Echinimonas agarilytica TaxID=1215918 RepID=A0AA41W648_9GAMM|nr:ComEA family DNA-binding protein [Echinimonas agarilytica]
MSQPTIAAEPAPSETSVITNKVNINMANAEVIADLLYGIGLKKAEAIVNYRDAHGDFTSIDQLTEVKGVGSALVERNRNFIEI